ncbi:MAG: hypothetical protein FWG45_04875, partial [Oscillospiraceae bacterium]|nr:hypothetical protein [Oscillospiraceae bacterium]
MKTKKLLTATIASALLLTSLTACSETEPIAESARTLPTTESTARTTPPADETETETSPSMEWHPGGLSIDIKSGAKSANVKNKIVEEIKAVKSTKKSELEAGLEYHRIAGITEIYMPPVQIQGMEMYRFDVAGSSYGAYYFPVGVNRDSFEESYRSGISLGITRTDKAAIPYEDVTYPVTLEQLIKGYEDEAEIRDGFAYHEIRGLSGEFLSCYIYGLLGDTWFDIYSPNDLGFDAMRDMANQVVKSSELV